MVQEKMFVHCKIAVSEDLDKSIREEAAKRGKSLNQTANYILNHEIQSSSDSCKDFLVAVNIEKDDKPQKFIRFKAYRKLYCQI